MPAAKKFRNSQNGEVYELYDFTESAQNGAEGSTWVSYRNVTTGKSYSRPYREFFGDRYDEVQSVMVRRFVPVPEEQTDAGNQTT